jgi:chorismate mutase
MHSTPSPHDAPSAEVLSRHRTTIDRIDRTIVALLSERFRTGLLAAEVKAALGQASQDSAREAAVLDHVRHATQRPLSPESAARIFATIISETRAIQEAGDDAS